MVGVMRRLATGPITEPEALAEIRDKLLKNKSYRAAILGSTASEESVRNRLRLATEAFQAAR